MNEATHAHPALAHQFEDLGQQHEASTLGMWMFLTTEILFFGGLFMAYALYRWSYPEAFLAASHHQDIILGAINTAVLICSSLTVAMSVFFVQTNQQKLLVGMLVLTMLLGAVFLVIKAIEYTEHIHHGLFPGQWFHFDGPLELASRVQMFFVLYFAMTGLHASHMVVGLGIYSWLLWRARRGDFDSEYYSPVEICGLYWHFVDIVWIFLFPLLYLIGRH